MRFETQGKDHIWHPEPDPGRVRASQRLARVRDFLEEFDLATCTELEVCLVEKALAAFLLNGKIGYETFSGPLFPVNRGSADNEIPHVIKLSDNLRRDDIAKAVR